jgi:hypothetical protein
MSGWAQIFLLLALIWAAYLKVLHVTYLELEAASIFPKDFPTM